MEQYIYEGEGQGKDSNQNLLACSNFNLFATSMISKYYSV